MISNQQISDYINKLKPHTVTTARYNSKFRVPLIIENLYNVDHLSTHDESPDSNIETATKESRKYINITITNKYRFDGRWYVCHNSVKHPEESFVIYKVDNLPMGTFFDRINKKSFIGRLDKLVFQKLLEPFMLFINYKFIKWDNIEIVYDCDDTWLIIRNNENFDYYSMRFNVVDMVILPFPCEYFGEEPQWLFDLNYNALSEYLQSTAFIDENGEFKIKSPTLDTEYEYRHMMFNVGGWLYSQIKRFNLGILPQDRVNKLQSFSIYKYIKNDYGVTVNTLITRYNGLDKDVPTNRALFEKLYYMPIEKYENHPMFRFDEDGYQKDDGDYKVVITDDNIIYRSMESSEDKILYNLSEINNLLFRENYLIFEDGLFIPKYPIMTSINNITFCDNPENKRVNIKVIYHKDSDHVIRNTDKFLKSYMNEQARIYLQFLYHTNYAKRVGLDAISVDYKLFKDIDAMDVNTVDGTDNFIPEGRVELLTAGNEVEILRRTIPYAFTDTGKIFKPLEAYYLDEEFAFVPKLTDYMVYINDYEHDAVGLIDRAIEALDFSMDRKKLYEENIHNALTSIIDFDPSLLNGIYHTFVDQRTFTGRQANESLIYTFMYENRRGLKIPRKLYKNHESYIMVFVNGELIKNYYRMIAYANFFFIPLDDGEVFDNDDVIEVLFFKNVNNNQIRFRIDKMVNPDEYFGIDIETGLPYYNLLIEDLDTGRRYEFTLKTLENNKEDYTFYDMNIFQPYIRPKELCIFSFYPKYMLEYPTLITEPDPDRAFNISYRDSTNQICIKGDGIKHIIDNDTFDDFSEDDKYIMNCLVATSKHKFIYQRLYVERKSYRIKLDKRFRYCDNQRQYVLFINGRRMVQNSYLITIPKHTRPFTELYLYTARFVGPEDRIELFYLPYNMEDINIKLDCELKESGYFTFKKTALKTPISKDLYLFFINGKKIPSTQIVDIDSNTVRINTNTNALNYMTLTPINIDTLPEVVDYMEDEFRISKYDSIVNYLKTHAKDHNTILDTLFGCSITMTNNEEDKIWANVGKIAILNEIVRDFWVTSGYDYQKKLFVYDYEDDELYERTEDGVLILPALDATPEINIPKNDISLLYFYTTPRNLLFEIGDTCTSCSFYWEYSQRLNEDWRILHQTLNGVELDVNAREYEWVEDINTPRKFTLRTNTGYNYLVHDTYLDFVNGIYWGNIDEDELQYYKRKNAVQYFDEIFAIIRKDGQILTVEEQDFISNNYKANQRIPDDNYIVRKLSYEVMSTHMWSPWTTPLQNYTGHYNGFIAVDVENGIIYEDIFGEVTGYVDPDFNTGDPNDGQPLPEGTIIDPLGYYAIPEFIEHRPEYGYYDEEDLPTIINRLDKHLCRTPNIKLNNYVIGNNNNFVFACPKRYVYNYNWEWCAEFYLPDPNGEDIVRNCRDDKTTPIYTNGNFDDLQKTLVKLYEMKMDYMGECWYTNEFGFKEQYCVWKTNGFFTRLFENYGFTIRIKIGDYNTNGEIVYDNKTEQIMTVINYLNGEEYEAPNEIPEEHTHNAPEEETMSVDVAGTASTLPKDNAASIKKTATRVVHTESNKPADANLQTIDISSLGGHTSPKTMTDQEVKDLLDQGIFLI